MYIKVEWPNNNKASDALHWDICGLPPSPWSTDTAKSQGGRVVQATVPLPLPLIWHLTTKVSAGGASSRSVWQSLGKSRENFAGTL